jgi:hypothetical protein
MPLTADNSKYTTASASNFLRGAIKKFVSAVDNPASFYREEKYAGKWRHTTTSGANRLQLLRRQPDLKA